MGVITFSEVFQMSTNHIFLLIFLLELNRKGSLKVCHCFSPNDSVKKTTDNQGN